MPTPNGMPAGAPSETSDISDPSTVVGINFGNSFSSIAVITKKGLAECIANEDGERQIASAISFHGEEVYIGNQARPQLVKNDKNTIVGFRNLLGKRFTDVKSTAQSSRSSAPLTEDPETGLPAYKVTVLVPAPMPLTPEPPSTRATSTLVSRATTPAVSKAPTPRSEPVQQDRILTVNEITTMYLKSLLRTAEDFLGQSVQGVVISVPSWFDNNAREALSECAKAADVRVLQLLDDAGAASVLIAEPSEIGTATEIDSIPAMPTDRNSLIIDVGASSLELTLLSLRAGLPYVMASSVTPNLGGDAIDDKLIAFFSKDFTKKTKTPLTVLSPSKASESDRRAEAKLRLAVEFTKRTLSATTSTGSTAASCSVESLKDGMDYTGTINRLRFDLEMRTTYASIVDRIQSLLKECGSDPIMVDELVFVGGSAALPGLREAVALAFPQDIHVGNYGEDSSQVLSKGCAYQARLVAPILLDPSSSTGMAKAFDKMTNLTHATMASKTIGVHFANSSTPEAADKHVVPIILADTPLPVRRTVGLEIEVPEAAGEETTVGVEIWEVTENVKVELDTPPPLEKSDGGDDEDDDEAEPEEIRSKALKPEKQIAALSFRVKGKGRTKVLVQLLLEADGSMKASAWQPGWEEGKGLADLKKISS